MLLRRSVRGFVVGGLLGLGGSSGVWSSVEKEAQELVQESLSQATSFEGQQEAERIVQESFSVADVPETKAEAAQIVEGSLGDAEPVQERAFKEGQGCSGLSSLSSPKCPHASGSQKEVFLLFVSFSLPEASLQQLSAQMKALGGRVILKGLIEDSFQKTQEKLFKMGLELEIDPLLFESYGITRVPTYVLSQGSTYDQVAGHISPQTALELLSEQGTLKEVASHFLSKQGERG